MENRQKLRKKLTAEEMKMINKDENLLNFTITQRNEYRSELLKHQVRAITLADKQLSDNTEFWENVEK